MGASSQRGRRVMAVFSTGMRDDRVITFIEYWQEAPLGYSGPCSVLPTALNYNHAGKHLLGLKPGQSLSCDRPSQAFANR